MEEDFSNVGTQKINEKQNNVEIQKDKKGKHAQVNSKNNKLRNKKQKEDKEDINKSAITILVATIIFLAISTFVLDVYYIYTKLIPKFKNIQLEIGYENELSIKDFITNEKYLEDSKLLTDLSIIDFNKVRRI